MEKTIIKRSVAFFTITHYHHCHPNTSSNPNFFLLRLSRSNFTIPRFYLLHIHPLPPPVPPSPPFFLLSLSLSLSLYSSSWVSSYDTAAADDKNFKLAAIHDIHGFLSQF